MRASATRTGVVLAMVIAAALAAAAALAPAAGADTIAGKRAEAARASAALDRVTAVLAQRTERLRQAVVRREAAQAEVAAARATLRRLAADLDSAHAQLALLLVERYKDGDGDAAAYVLGAGSFDELVDRVDLIGRVDRAEGDLVREIAATKAEARRQHERLRVAAAEAVREAAAAAAARRQVAREVDRRAAILAALEADVRRLVEAAQRRRARAAAAAAAAVARTTRAEDASPAPAASPPPAPSNVFYGDATWYGPGFEGATTASGEPFDPRAFTAASPWLPFDTRVRVTNLATGASVVVRINDRGPFGGGVLDLTPAAAEPIGLLASGHAYVRAEVL